MKLLGRFGEREVIASGGQDGPGSLKTTLVATRLTPDLHRTHERPPVQEYVCGLNFIATTFTFGSMVLSPMFNNTTVASVLGNVQPLAVIEAAKIAEVRDRTSERGQAEPEEDQKRSRLVKTSRSRFLFAAGLIVTVFALLCLTGHGRIPCAPARSPEAEA
jgi:hypothetical protein